MTKQELNSIIKIHGDRFTFLEIPTYIRIREGWKTIKDYTRDMRLDGLELN